jgi:hypothetical protein
MSKATVIKGKGKPAFRETVEAIKSNLFKSKPNQVLVFH